MSIAVTCPSCFKRFQVNDKFAGKTGPCPSCKKPIKVPDKSEEVVVHAPEAFEHGGRGVDGKLALKPIDREETKITPLMIVSIVAAVLLTFIIAYFGRALFQNTIVAAIGLLIVSPPLAWAAYSFLRNDELEPFRGNELYLRSLICGVVYVVLWGVFMYAFGRVQPDDFMKWGVLTVPFLLAGTAVAYLALELEPGNAFCHYAFYLIVTNLLYAVVWLKWIWSIAK